MSLRNRPRKASEALRSVQRQLMQVREKLARTLRDFPALHADPAVLAIDPLHLYPAALELNTAIDKLEARDA